MASPIEFRAASQASVNWITLTVPVPGDVQQDDLLLLFVTGNRTDVSITLDDAGWQILGDAVDGSMQTKVWFKTADPGDTATTLTVRSTAITKLDAQLLAYAGTDPADPVAQTAVAVEPGTSADHTTPTLQVSQPTWVVSYWADKTSSSDGWVVDPALQERAQSIGTGGGRITSLTADTGGPVGPGTVGGHTARSTSGDKATMWTLALRSG